MRFGTALKLTRSGFHVRRSGWKDAPDSMHESGIGPCLVWNDGGLILEWGDIGFEGNRLTYSDLDSDDWELTELVDFGTALHLMHLGFYVRRRGWTGYASLSLGTTSGETEFRYECSSGDSNGFQSVSEGLHDGDLCGLTREDRFAKDWGIASDFTPYKVAVEEPDRPTPLYPNEYDCGTPGKDLIKEEIQAAVKKLDIHVDSHWVMTGAHKGKPKLQAVEDAYGKAGLTRQDIEAALPGYTRNDA